MKSVTSEDLTYVGKFGLTQSVLISPCTYPWTAPHAHAWVSSVHAVNNAMTLSCQSVEPVIRRPGDNMCQLRSTPRQGCCYPLDAMGRRHSHPRVLAAGQALLIKSTIDHLIDHQTQQLLPHPTPTIWPIPSQPRRHALPPLLPGRNQPVGTARLATASSRPLRPLWPLRPNRPARPLARPALRPGLGSARALPSHPACERSALQPRVRPARRSPHPKGPIPIAAWPRPPRGSSR